jgi:hypothetical protein
MTLTLLCPVRSLLLITFASAFILPSESSGQSADVTQLVPAQISFATEFIQHLSNAGLTVQRVSLSKYNGGFFGPTKAAWIKTDKGVIEVVFFDKLDELEAIQLKEEESGNPNYHRYRITLTNTTHTIEGRLPVYFMKYQNKLVITYDRQFSETLTLLFARLGK